MTKDKHLVPFPKPKQQNNRLPHATPRGSFGRRKEGYSLLTRSGIVTRREATLDLLIPGPVIVKTGSGRVTPIQ
jgi:hypothetical protein